MISNIQKRDRIFCSLSKAIAFLKGLTTWVLRVTSNAIAITLLKKKAIAFLILSLVGWGATHVGGFPDLSDVALEQSATQHRLKSMLSFTPFNTTNEISKYHTIVELLQYHFLFFQFLDVFHISKPFSFAVLLQFLCVLVRAVQ
jgi:hypothetical protein